MIKRILVEDLNKAVSQEAGYPDDAYAYIDSRFKLFRHHSELVKDQMEEESVDEELLVLAISLAEQEGVFTNDDTKQAVLEHLYMHREQIKAKKHKNEREKDMHEEDMDKEMQDNKKKNMSKKKKVTCSRLLKVINEQKPEIKNAVASLVSVQTTSVSIIYYLEIKNAEDYENQEAPSFLLPLEVTYDGEGNLLHVRMFDSIVSPDALQDVLDFINLLQNKEVV